MKHKAHISWRQQKQSYNIGQTQVWKFMVAQREEKKNTMKTDINDIQLIEWWHLLAILSEHSEMLVTVMSSTKHLMITNFTWTQTPVGYLRQREITIHISYQLSDIIAKMQWCSVTLSLDLISRVDLCNVISLNSPYLRVFPRVALNLKWQTVSWERQLKEANS